ncbi:MAG TPA: hypothetical protein VGP78_06580 [Solirubrobacteraceae bacterium]|nr:hypothetical protein [Solirubrobacteraceae bacterium]
MAIARRPSDRRLAVAIAAVAVVVVAAPIVAALIRALDAGYVVNGDQAIIAARASDVFTSRFPLVGGFSTVTYLVHERAYHPGPLLFWLLAVPARVHWSGALPAFMAAVNAASAAGVLLLARRRGGDGLMLATAAALVLTFGSLRTDVIRDVWNPSAAVVPFTLLIYLCWSLACGELKLLPLAVLVASFTMHCHVAYVTPSSLLLATGLVGLVLARRSGGGEPRSGRRWWIAAGVVALLCWSGPLIERDNLGTLADAAGARDEALGSVAALRAVERALGVSPWWLHRAQSPLSRVADVVTGPPVATWATAVALLLALSVLLGIAARRRRADVVAACAVALALCVALYVLTAAYPKSPEQLASYGYTSWWAAPAGMFAWLTAGWSAVTLFVHRHAPRGALLTAGVLVAMAAAVFVIVDRQGRNADEQWYQPVRTVLGRVHDELPSTHSVRVDGAFALELQAAIIYDLRRRGLEVSAPADVAVQLSPEYFSYHRPFDWVVDVSPGAVPPDFARPIARVTVGRPTYKTFTVSLRRIRRQV